MRVLAAGISMAATLVLSTATRLRVGVDPGRYLRADPALPDRAGTKSVLTATNVGAALLGAVVGALGAAGLLIPVVSGPLPAASLVGAAAGPLIVRVRRSRASDRKSARLLQELPTAADVLALHVLSGASVATAITRFVEGAAGIAATELGEALSAHGAGTGLAEALRLSARGSAHHEAGRLYDLLGSAHHTGGSLAEALAALATDYRAALARAVTAEGGRRAVAAYGPILVLMVPVTLLFLMFPTLVGLTSLSTR